MGRRHAYSPGVTIAAPTDKLTVGRRTEGRALYLDCNATTPLDPRVRDEVVYYLDDEFGNAGSRTHLYGQAAKERVNAARAQVGAVVAASSDEVIFTSGATESNNLALLGLVDQGQATGRRHIVSTRIEHKAVLEPLEALAALGFEITLLDPTAGGWIDPAAVAAAVRPDTLLVSLMAVNNETGVIQPIQEIADRLAHEEPYIHVDAAQAFGKIIDPLRHPRLDLISVSGHKIHGPKGVGALVARRRGYRRPPLRPLMYGGGQERGLKPGTLPVPLIAGLGTASELAGAEHEQRSKLCGRIKAGLLEALHPLHAEVNGDQDRVVSHTLNVSVPGVDSEAAILALKDLVAISNGSACTSQKYDPSHVLLAMGYDEPRIRGALRFSWSYMTEDIDWSPMVGRLRALQRPL